MTLFDTHAHYTDESFEADRQEVLQSVHSSGVELIVNASSDGASSMQSIELAKKCSFVYAAVGWHPHEAHSFTEASPDIIRLWCQDSKVKAIGEIGLDYYYDLSDRKTQRRVFVRQMELAQELNLPVVIHDRDAHADCMDIVSSFPKVRGEFHCYSGSAEMAKELLSRGWYLGFTGAITFKNARKALETIKMCPMDRILIETDCPYLTPVPFRGKRNDSRYLPYMADKIGEIKGIEASEVARLTMENGKRFFDL